MIRPTHIAALMIVTLALLLPAPAFAKGAKKYQVTGTVLAVTEDMITVQKGDEKWELNRTADTKIDGELKVGAKVTVEYTMSATDVENKAATAKPAPKTSK